MDSSFSFSDPLPETLAGYQLLCSTLIEKGDLLIPKDDPRPENWTWACGLIGKMTNEDGENWQYRAYRKIPVPTHLDDKPALATQVMTSAGKAVVIPVTSGIPDTGARRSFGTGAVRDASVGKGHFHSIPPCALRAVARRFEDGAKKYEKNNWMKGIPFSAYMDSIARHTLGIAEGDTSEDHHGALTWNSMALTWTEEEVKAGRLPKELDDLPYRRKTAA